MTVKQISSEENGSLLRRATVASIVTALFLIVIKFTAWLSTGSLSVLASLFDSVMDGAASLINFLAVRYSLKSADDEHRFGHGKAEALAGLGQACFIAGSALVLLINGLERLTTPAPLQSLGAGIIVMLCSIIATVVLLAIQNHVIKRTGSVAIKADSLHYATDLLTNGSTILALFLVQAGFLRADPIICILISIFILHSAWRIGYEAVQLLMDRQLPADQLEKIYRLARKTENVLGVHDLRTRQSGQVTFIQLHLDLDSGMELRRAHAIAKKVEHEILALFPRADIIIHQDPFPKGNRTL